MAKPSYAERNTAAMRWLRRASLLEGTTLLLLVFLAVPIKYVLGNPMLVSVLGPLHGLAFLGFMGLLARSHWLVGWTSGQLLRLAVGAMLPFGAFINARLLRNTMTGERKAPSHSD